MKATPSAIDQYISDFPENVRELLEQMRVTIRKAAPEAEEIISYGMPAFKQQGNLVYFAGYKHHIGFYPSSSGISEFQKDFAGYKNSKGAVQFPLDQPLPLELVTKIVKFRVKENLENAEAKKKKKMVKSGGGLQASLGAPARRALENKGIKTVEDLAKFTEAEILELHGMGPGSMPKLQQALKEKGLAFKK